MRVSRKQAEENRELVLKTAGKLFRERGFNGIGVADLMRAAGLTVGGFYNSFDSKDDLMAQACQMLIDDINNKWLGHIADPKIEDPYQRIGRTYLSKANRDNPGQACMFNTLASEVPRHQPELKQIFSDGTLTLIEHLATMMQGENDADRKNKAIATFSQWVGAQVLARATAGSALSEEILDVAKSTTNIT